MKAWTDYPFVELGDKPNQKASIRRVEVLTYDRNKYCDVVVNGVQSNIKRCYIYLSAGRCGEVDSVSEEALEFLPSGLSL